MNLSLHTRLLPRAAVAALALAAALGAAAQAMPGPGMGPGHGHGGMGPGMAMPGRMLDGVNASAEQKSRIEAIFKAARDQQAQQREAGRKLHEQAMQALAAPSIDMAKLEALRQQQLAQHDQASKRMLQAMVDAAQVLTPEQRSQLAAKMQARQALMERHRREREAIDPPPAR